MADLIYLTLMSLDGYIEDSEGKFDWAAPDEEVHRFVNDLVRGAGVYLYGRRMYETMAAWETDPTLAGMAPFTRDFAEMWQAADKIVYSRTLATVATRKTRIERAFDPETVRQMKNTSSRDLFIGGPDLAGHAFRAGLVDQCHLFLAPMSVGGGKQALPNHLRLGLELLEGRRFGNGMVFLRYRTKS